MATDYKQRLQNLRGRRLGLEAVDFSTRDAADIAASILKSESYESRAKSDALRYALGAMQEVDPAYTKISIEEGERVKNQLDANLPAKNLSAEFRYQGSVPLNIHIRWASDIDLLVLHRDFLVYDSTGPRAHLYTPSHVDVLGRMQKMRFGCEEILQERFPRATVDVTGSKAIAISGGSLRRKVDVVPAHWDDTAEYQASFQLQDRQIWVLDKDVPETVSNRPFRHMHRIEEKDLATQGGAKKAIRLLKNVRRDADKEIMLSSYDIASMVWNFDSTLLTQPNYLEGLIFAITQMHLKYYVMNEEIAKQMVVPDGSRRVFDSQEKLSALRQLSAEMDDLGSAIAAELGIGGQSPEVLLKSLASLRV